MTLATSNGRSSVLIMTLQDVRQPSSAVGLDTTVSDRLPSSKNLTSNSTTSESLISFFKRHSTTVKRRAKEMKSIAEKIQIKGRLPAPLPRIGQAVICNSKSAV